MKRISVKLAFVLLICALIMSIVACVPDTPPAGDPGNGGDNEHTHSYSEEITKAPTCTEAGVKTFTCSCEDSYTEVVDALGHTETVDEAVAATCTTAGKTEGKHCSVCNEVLVAQETIDAPGHTEVVDAGVDATCTTAGKTEGKHCSVCNEVLVAQESIDALGHTEVIDKAISATCTTDGKTEGKHCSVCNEILVAQQTVAATGHTEVTLPAVAPTCDTTGLTAGVKCSACKEILTAQTVIDALGHTEVVDAAVAPTCTATGKTEGKHCSVCNEVLLAQQPVDSLGHKYDTKVTAPTCTDGGYTTHTCSVCDDSYVDDYVDAKGHSEKTLDAVAPTCTATGLTEGKQCTVCNVITIAQQTVDALGHSEKTLSALAPTCTEAGKTEGKQCTVCNVITVVQQTVDALGHTGAAAVKENYNDSTCSAEGSYESVVYCSVCKEELSRTTETVAKKAHTEVLDKAIAPTCTEAGKTKGLHCSVCNEVLKEQEIVPALGHKEEIVPGKEATCTTTGLSDGKKCSVCNATLLAQETIPALDHKICTIPGYDSTCEEEGQTDEVYCSRCDETFSAKTSIPAKGHTYDDIHDLTCNVCKKERACSHPEDSIVVVHGSKPTCTTAGKTDGTKCGVCGDVVDAQTIIDATGHSKTAIPKVEPTCTEVGYTAGERCRVCNAVLVAPTEIPAKGHTIVVDAAVESTCTKTGLTEGKHCSVSTCKEIIVAQTVTPVKDHSYSNAWSADGAQHWHACTVCGDKKDASNHAYTTEVENSRVEPTCEKDGKYTLACVCGATKDVAIGATGHKASKEWSSDDSKHWHVCENCNQAVDSKNHSYDAVVTAPTCTKEGYTTYTCTVCKDSYKADTTDKLGHSYKTVVTAPTCENDGYTTYTCTVCGETHNGDYVNALGHTEVIDAAVAPTCTETGLTEGKHCSVCGKVLIAQTVKEALGHVSVVDKAVAPTCTATGLTEGSHCDVCSKVLVAQETVAALGHTSSEAVEENYNDSTCSAEGSYDSVVYCAVCGAELSRTTETIATKAHTVIIDEAKAPTCTETGLTEGSHCDVCGEILKAQEEVPVAGHTEAIDEAKAPTCTETGLTEGKHCSACGEVLVAQEEVGVLGHDMVTDAAVAPDCENTGLTEGSHCSRCDHKVAQEEIAALGHKYYHDCDATCNVCASERTVTGHTYDENDTICNSCGYDTTGANNITNGGFENGLDGWTVVGNIGNVSSDTHYWVGDPDNADGFEFGMDGDKMFSAYAPGAFEGAVGTLTSPTFVVGGSGYVTFKLGAARDCNYVYVDVVDADTKQILARYYNGLWTDADKSGCKLVAYKADLSDFRGQEIFFRISDNADSGYGLFFLDSFVTYYENEPEGFNYATPASYEVSGTIYDLFNGGFEMGNVQGWWSIGEIGVVTNATGYWGDNIPYGKDGEFLFTGVESFGADTMREGNKGTLISSAFEIGGTGWISFMLGGGGNELCYVQIIDATTGEVLTRYHQQAQQDAKLIQYAADLSKYIGRTVRIQVVDEAENGWGCVSFDNVVTYYTSTDSLPEAIVANNLVSDKSVIYAELELEVKEQGDYTLDSYNAYIVKLNAAKELLGNLTVAQEIVNDAANALKETRLALALRTVEEKADANKSFNIVSGNLKEIALDDYINTNNLSNITYSVNSANNLVTLSDIADGKFTITAGDVKEATSVTVSIVVSYKGEEKLTVDLTVQITNDVAPTVSNDEFSKIFDAFNKTDITIDLSENVDNAGNLPLTYSVNGTVISGSSYTFTLGEYTDEITYETLVVTIDYTANGEAKSISYTYKLGLYDSAVFRLDNGDFENGLDGWTVVGNIGDVSTEKSYWYGDFGMDGDKMFSAYAPGAFEGAVGTLTSSSFKVGGSGFVTFKIGAMRDQNYVYIDVVDAETKQILARYYNGLWERDKTHCTLVAYKADLSAFMGREVFFRISDNADSDYGLFFLDSFVTYYENEPDGFNTATHVDYALSGSIYDLFNGGFEMGGVQGWLSVGEIGVVTNANGYWGDNIPYEKVGDFLFTGVESNGADTMREGNKGTLTSSVFEVGGTGWISFKLGGGGNELCYVQIIDAVTGEILARYHQQAQHDAKLIQYAADLSAYVGRTVRIQVVDYASSGWGCVSFDHVVTYHTSQPDGIEAIDIKGNLKSTVENGSFENGLDGWSQNIWEAGAHNTLGWVESSEHDAGWYTKNDGRKDGNNLFTFCRPDGTNCENTKGELVSSRFALQKNSYVSFRFGGAGTRDVWVELVRADGEVIARFYNEAPGKVNTEMHAYYYQYTGENADCFFRVVDNSTGNYGCFVVDDFRANLKSAPEGFIPAIQ